MKQNKFCMPPRRPNNKKSRTHTPTNTKPGFFVGGMEPGSRDRTPDRPPPPKPKRRKPQKPAGSRGSTSEDGLAGSDRAGPSSSGLRRRRASSLPDRAEDSNRSGGGGGGGADGDSDPKAERSGKARRNDANPHVPPPKARRKRGDRKGKQKRAKIKPYATLDRDRMNRIKNLRDRHHKAQHQARSDRLPRRHAPVPPQVARRSPGAGSGEGNGGGGSGSADGHQPVRGEEKTGWLEVQSMRGLVSVGLSAIRSESVGGASCPLSPRPARCCLTDPSPFAPVAAVHPSLVCVVKSSVGLLRRSASGWQGGRCTPLSGVSEKKGVGGGGDSSILCRSGSLLDSAKGGSVAFVLLLFKIRGCRVRWFTLCALLFQPRRRWCRASRSCFFRRRRQRVPIGHRSRSQPGRRRWCSAPATQVREGVWVGSLSGWRAE